MNVITRLLHEIDEGDQHAASDLLPLVYEELRKLATAKMAAEREDHTLQATALVHEAYLRLVGSNNGNNWTSPAHFFGAAAEAMRRILVDRARERRSVKRGGELERVLLVEDQISVKDRNIDLIALDEALDALAIHDGRKAELVKLRYFVGLPLREAANVLGISESTADADWAYAKSWLRVRIGE